MVVDRDTETPRLDVPAGISSRRDLLQRPLVVVVVVVVDVIVLRVTHDGNYGFNMFLFGRLSIAETAANDSDPS